MAYEHTNGKGVKYYLHKNAEGGKGTPCDLPEDRVVCENPRNGFLTLKKKA